MTSFAKAAKEMATYTRTENGAFAYNTTDSAMMDLYSTLGALRTRNSSEIIGKFSAAFDENPVLATKALFYCGDCREGLGERRTFRICLKWLAENHPDILVKNIDNIHYYNRWDSIFELMDTPLENVMWHTLEKTLVDDLYNYSHNKPISLLAKWMPSINTSSYDTKVLARKCINALEIFNEKKYRKMLAALRKYLEVPEHIMSARDWDKINYEKVPSYAMKKYRNAFKNHDGVRFDNYLKLVSSGEKKINSSVLYPYDIIKPYLDINNSDSYYLCNTSPDNVLELQWKNLPNYIEGNNNVLVMCDCSGSMFWGENPPIYTSIGLGIYFAERNNGPFKDLIMTFSSNPMYVDISNKPNLLSKVKKIFANDDIGMGTNLKAGFDLILNTAVKNNLSKEDMPKALVVVSDMEIDSYSSNLDFVETVKRDFEKYEYEMPKLILWNVESRNDTFLTKSNDVILVGGHSASIFKTFLNCLTYSGYEIMVNTLMSERYERVIV